MWLRRRGWSLGSGRPVEDSEASPLLQAQTISETETYFGASLRVKTGTSTIHSATGDLVSVEVL